MRDAQRGGENAPERANLRPHSETRFAHQGGGRRGRRASCLVCAGLTSRMELYDEAIGIPDLRVPAEVPFGRRRVINTEVVELSTTAVEILAAADVERETTEPAQRQRAIGLAVQPEGESGGVVEDDADHRVFVFDAESSFEAEDVDVPVAAAQYIRYR